MTEVIRHLRKILTTVRNQATLMRDHCNDDFGKPINSYMLLRTGRFAMHKLLYVLLCIKRDGTDNAEHKALIEERIKEVQKANPQSMHLEDIPFCYADCDWFDSDLELPGVPPGNDD